MSKCIIYGSKYGTSKQYADELARSQCITALSYTEAKDLSNFDTVIYFGGIYASSIKGLSKIAKKISPPTRFIVVTVGISNPQHTETIEAIKTAVKKQVPDELNPEIFNLRGGIDYSKLSFMHGIMMKMLMSQVKKTPLDKQSEDNKMMIATYNSKVDFVDFKSLQPIIAVL